MRTIRLLFSAIFFLMVSLGLMAQAPEVVPIVDGNVFKKSIYTPSYTMNGSGADAQYNGLGTSTFLAWSYFNGGVERMRFRLMPPVNFDNADNIKYPIIIFFHGVGETYQDPKPGNPDFVNEHQLVHGGHRHRNAVLDYVYNPGVSDGTFNGFLLYPQTDYRLSGGRDWYEANNVAQVKNILLELIKNYDVDPERVYITGLSGGGDGVWQFMNDYPKLTAAAVPISAGRQEYQHRDNDLKNIPLWMAQGGNDQVESSKAIETKVVADAFRDNGNDLRYIYFPNKGHGVWTDTWAKNDYFDFLNSKKKNMITVYHQQSQFCEEQSISVVLGVQQGHSNYEWRKDGIEILGANNNTYHATSPGDYQVRFLRNYSDVPGGAFMNTGWTDWSEVVTLGNDREATDPISISAQQRSVNLPALDGSTAVELHGTPGQFAYQWLRDLVDIPNTNDSVIEVSSGGSYIAKTRSAGEPRYFTDTQSDWDGDGTKEPRQVPVEFRPEPVGCWSDPSNAIVVTDEDGPNAPLPPRNLLAVQGSETTINLTWEDRANNELGFEIYRSTTSGGPYVLISITGPGNETNNPISYSDNTAGPANTFYYKIRAVNNEGGSAYSNEALASTIDDTEPPTSPLLQVKSLTPNSIELQWEEPTDNVGVVAYDIYKDFVFFASTTDLSYNLTGFNTSQYATFHIVAKDASGNLSTQSNIVTSFSGINYDYYHHGNLDFAHQITTNGTLIKSGFSTNFNIYPEDNSAYTNRGNQFAYIFNGYILISSPGNYTFYTSSDDGSMLRINGILVVDNDEPHGKVEENGHIYLTSGFHSIDVQFFENGGGEVLEVRWQGPGISKALIPSEALYYNITGIPISPEAPGSLVATQIDYKSIGLTWVDNSANENVFEIFRSANGGTSYSKVGSVAANENSYTDTELQGGQQYHYKIRAVGTTGVSDYSNISFATTGAAPTVPSTPTNLQVSILPSSEVQLTWNDNSTNEDYFNLYRTISPNNQGWSLIKVIDVDATSTIDEIANGNTTYFYKLTASNDGGASSYSNIVSVLTANNLPQINNLIDRSVQYGTTLEISVAASDPDGDIITLSATGIPGFGSFIDNGHGKGTFSFSPGNITAQTFPIELVAHDGVGQTTASFNLFVSDNENPVIASISPVNITEGYSSTFDVTATDDSGNGDITLSVGHLPDFMDFHDNGGGSGTFSMNTHIGDFGNYKIDLSANDGENGIGTREITVNVLAARKENKVYVNFTASAIEGAPWNNMNTTNSTMSDLLDDQGNNSGWDVFSRANTVYRSPFGGTPPSDGVFPRDVIWDSHAVYYNQNAGDGNGKGHVTFSNLNKDLIYNFTVHGNNNSTYESASYPGGNGPCWTIYEIDGMPEMGDTLLAVANYYNTVRFVDIFPDENGEIRLNFRALIRPEDGKGKGNLSAIVIDTYFDDGVLPTAPQLSLNVLSSSSIKLDWIDESKNEQRFNVYRSDAYAGLYAKVGTVNKDVLTFTDNGLDANETYYYKVAAENLSGEVFSEVKSETTMASPPIFADILPQYVVAGDQLHINIAAISSSGETIDLQIIGLPQFGQFEDHNDGTGTLVITPDDSRIGTYKDIKVVATAPIGGVSEISILLNVLKNDFKEEVYINFSNSDVQVGNIWNNIFGTQTNGRVINGLVNANQQNSNISVVLGNGWSGSSDNIGGVFAGNVGRYEDNVIASGWTTNNTGQLILSGLDDNYIYNIILLGNSATSEESTKYTIDGQSQSMDVFGNISEIIRFNGIAPDGDGMISIDVEKAVSTMGYVNSMVIQSYNKSYPVAPSGLVAKAKLKTTIELNWSDNSGNEDGFEIYRYNRNDQVTELIATTLSDVTSFSDQGGLTKNTTYDYWVRAINGNTNSKNSNVAYAKTFDFSIYINFNDNLGGGANAPQPWNNMDNTPFSGLSVLNLRDDEWVTTSIDLYLDEFGAGGRNTSGAQTGDNSGIFPDVVMESYYYNEPSEQTKFRLADLNINYEYDLQIFGSEDGTATSTAHLYPRKTEYYLNENEIVLLDNANNTTNTADILNISPDSQTNEIIFYMRSSNSSGSRWGFINAMVVNAYSQIDSDEKPIVVYHAENAKDISLVTNWNEKADETGSDLINFDNDGVTYQLDESETYSISSNLDLDNSGTRLVFGNNSVVNINPGVTALTFEKVEVPAGVHAVISGDGNCTLVLKSGGLSIADGSSLTVDGVTLAFNENATLNNNGETGQIISQNASIVFNSSSALDSYMYFDSEKDSVVSLTINNSGSGSVYVGNHVKIKDVLQLDNGVLHTSDNLTLISDSHGTARIGQVATTANLTGDVTMQRYWERNRGSFYYIGTPILNQTIDSWIGDFRIHGFAGVEPGIWVNINKYDESINSWSPITSKTDPIEPGVGVSAYMYSSEFADGFIRYENTGEVHIGDFDFNLTYTAEQGGEEGWNLVANPYPSAINLGYVDFLNETSNLEGGIYVFDGENYQYNTWSPGLPTEPDFKIASGQGFFVRAVGENPTLHLTESVKIAEDATFLRKSNEVEGGQLDIKLVKENGKSVKAYMSFLNDATNGYDRIYDAVEFKNDDLNVSTVMDDKYLKINARQLEHTNSDSVFIVYDVNNLGTYTLEFVLSEFMQDRHETFTFIDLAKGEHIQFVDSLNYTFNITSNDQLVSNSRFFLIRESMAKLFTKAYKSMPGKKVSIPLMTENFHGISEATFRITWDGSLMKYKGVENIDGQIKRKHIKRLDKNTLEFRWEASRKNPMLDIIDGNSMFNIVWELSDKAAKQMEIQYNLGDEFNIKLADSSPMGLYSDFNTIQLSEYKIRGRINHIAGIPLRNVKVLYALTKSHGFSTTDKDGWFSLDPYGPVGEDLAIEFDYNSNDYEVDVKDLIELKQIVKDNRKIDHPIKEAILDLDKSGSISKADERLFTNNLLFGKYSSPEWLFIKMNEIFSIEDLVQRNLTLSYNELENEYLALLNGDVSGVIEGIDRTQGNLRSEPLRLRYSVVKDNKEGVYQYQILANENYDLKGIQLSMLLDKMNYQNIVPGAINPEIGITNQVASVLWATDIAQGKSINKDEVLFSLVLSGTEVNKLLLSEDNGLVHRAYNGTMDRLNIVLQSKDFDQDGLALQVFPNPVEISTTLQFVLTSQQNVNIRLTNALGQNVYSYDGSFNEGMNKFEWHPDDSIKPGVYICNIVCDEGTDIKQIIVR